VLPGGQIAEFANSPLDCGVHLLPSKHGNEMQELGLRRIRDLLYSAVLRQP
jgi:hypothetical protein